MLPALLLLILENAYELLSIITETAPAEAPLDIPNM